MDEFTELRNKFLTGIVISLIFIIPMIIFFTKSIPKTDSSIIDNIDNKKSIVILITDSKHKKFKSTMNQINIKKKTIDKYNYDGYQELIKKLNISESDIVVPTVIYIKKGDIKATLINIEQDKQLREFLKNYGVRE